MPATLTIEGLNRLDAMFGALPSEVRAGVKLTGPATEYGLVWEWGSARLTQPGPKTTWGINPNGDRRILTITAPQGWIRVNRREYIRFAKEEISKIQWNSIPTARWRTAMAEALYRAAQRCAALMEETAPVDTGQLVSGIVAVNEPDPILDVLGDELDLGRIAA